jgi:preprotein translocase subunit SecG
VGFLLRIATILSTIWVGTTFALSGAEKQKNKKQLIDILN